mmetsp:Transcript_22016/g.30974  ORF Transcript_22016/g.30974 Transcript_22016/m.30974 type:complete len:373 (-) Transcript_22016:30-1148(-)
MDIAGVGKDVGVVSLDDLLHNGNDTIGVLDGGGVVGSDLSSLGDGSLVETLEVLQVVLQVDELSSQDGELLIQTLDSLNQIVDLSLEGQDSVLESDSGLITVGLGVVQVVSLGGEVTGDSGFELLEELQDSVGLGAGVGGGFAKDDQFVDHSGALGALLDDDLLHLSQELGEGLDAGGGFRLELDEGSGDGSLVLLDLRDGFSDGDVGLLRSLDVGLQVGDGLGADLVVLIELVSGGVQLDSGGGEVLGGGLDGSLLGSDLTFSLLDVGLGGLDHGGKGLDGLIQSTQISGLVLSQFLVVGLFLGGKLVEGVGEFLDGNTTFSGGLDGKQHSLTNGVRVDLVQELSGAVSGGGEANQSDQKDSSNLHLLMLY